MTSISKPNLESSDSKVDERFSHYSFKHRVIAWISSHVFDNITYTARHGLNRGMRRKGGLGWLPQSLSGSVDTREQEFWKDLDLRGMVVYDIGAFQGILTLLFATRAREVICYEPNQRNRKRLEENVALNHLTNVRIRPVGLGASREILRMVFDPLMPGGATVEQNITEQLHKNSRAVTEEIPITTLDADIEENRLPVPQFVKVDVEGWEIEVLRGARKMFEQYHPDLFLEMHGETMNEKERKVAEIVDYLVLMGYHQTVHIETNTPISQANSGVAAEGHLYCRRQ